MPVAVGSSGPRLPGPLLRVNAPAETRAGISERVMGRAMGLGCPPPARSTARQRPRRERELNAAADVVPARAASSARVRAGPGLRVVPPRPPDDAVAPPRAA